MSDLPPRVPMVDDELREAVELLGAIKQTGRLRQSRQERVTHLLGCIPTQQQAKVWIPALNELRSEPGLSRAAG